VTRLSDDEVRAALADGLPGWGFADDAIAKAFTFESFGEAIAFIDRIARAAEDADHHPDLWNRTGRVVVTLTTHREHGVTAKDVALARTIDVLVDDEP
jgi:4a-hydroxytetrahydrobiopterin dehydratase